MKKLGFLGLISLILGMILLVNSFSGMTGFTISEKIPGKPYSIFGIVFILGGMVLIFLESWKSNLERKIEQGMFGKPFIKYKKKRKKKFLRGFGFAKERLNDFFDIDNLSNIEAFRLRKIVEQIYKQEKKEEKLVKERKMHPRYTITGDVEYEAPARWLQELYGIHWKDVPWIYRFKDNTTGKKYETLAHWGEEAEYKTEEKRVDKFENKYYELKKQGHDIDRPETAEVPKAYKEYIRRLREKAHKP